MNKQGLSTEHTEANNGARPAITSAYCITRLPATKDPRLRDTCRLSFIGILFSSLSKPLPKHQTVYVNLGTVKRHTILHDSNSNRVASTHNAIYFGFVTQRPLCRR